MSAWVLPTGLTPWAKWLQWFNDDIAQTLGELVRRLDLLVGTSSSLTHSRFAAEPDGVEGLSTRGNYDRLLNTEWLMAQDVPDEFMRRAAMNEHLFLAPGYKKKRTDRVIFALFDTGPLQLGAPRLLHIALWIVLARRVEQAGARLVWACAQYPDDIREGTRKGDLQTLLKARSWNAVTPVQLDAWQTQLAELPYKVSEYWYVGAAPSPAPAGVTHRVGIQRALLQDAIEVHLRAGHKESRLTLPLPDNQVATTVLKGDFGPLKKGHTQQTAKGLLSLMLPPVLAPSGKYVGVRLLDDTGVMTYPLANTHAHQGKPRKQIWPTDLQPLAMTFSGKGVTGVVDRKGQTQLWQMAPLQIDPNYRLVTPGAATLVPVWQVQNGTTQRVYMLKPDGELVFCEARTEPNRQVTVIREPQFFRSRVLAVEQQQALLIIAQQQGEDLVIERHNANGIAATFPLGRVPDKSPVLMTGSAYWGAQFGGCAVRLSAEDSEVWRLFSFAGHGQSGVSERDTRLPLGWKAIGARMDFKAPYDLTLLMLNQDGDTLATWYEGQLETLYTLPARIVRYSTLPPHGLIAMLTRDRQLVVYHWQTKTVKLFIQGDASHDAAQ